jgi:hypothetical protein
MATLAQSFEDRLQEIDAYLDLLDAIERSVREGTPKVGTTTITTQQQKILYSSVYIQLYNLVEATVSWCVGAVASATADNERWSPADLSDHLKKEWVRVMARTHQDLNREHRLESAILLCDRLIQALPVMTWEMDRRGAGSWDDNLIEETAQRLGFQLSISQDVRSDIKRKIRDDKPPLVLIKDFRNRLAHGSLSFGECGDNHTVDDLREIKKRTVAYLREVVKSFQNYLDRYEFLTPTRRPTIPVVQE